MIRRLFLAFIFLWNQAGFAALPMDARLNNPVDPFYNVKLNPLPKTILHLLMDNHYFVHSDGSIWSPGRGQEIRKSQMRVLIRRLKSTERLKALLRIDLILSQNGSGHLTPGELKKVRQILKKAWPFFTMDNRKHFSRYFSREELYSLNLTPPDEDSDPDLLSQEPLGAPPPPPLPAGFMSQLEAAPQSLAASPVAASSQIIQNAPLISPSASFLPQSQALIPTPVPSRSQTPVLPPAPVAVSNPPAQTPMTPAVMAPASVQPPSVAVSAPPAVMKAAPSLAAVSSSAQVLSHIPGASVAAASLAAAATASTALSGINRVASPAAVVTPVPSVAVSSAVKAAPSVSKSSAVVAGMTVDSIRQALSGSSVIGDRTYGIVKKPKGPKTLPPLKSYSLPSLSVVPSADFEKFLLNAPYSGDPKGLLRIIDTYGQEPFRSRALNIVMNLTPAIVIDPDRMEMEAHQKAFVSQKADGHFEATVALNSGAILGSKKEFIFEDWKAMLPVSSSAYQAMGLPEPKVEALDFSARPDKVKPSAWGIKTQIYSDGSERGDYSSFEMAGFLIHGLLDVEAQIEGWSAFPYQEESYAYSAQMLLYAQIKDGAKTEDFLDPQMRALFEDWLNHPARFHDFLIHSLASGQNALWDLRHIETSRRDYFIRKSYVACPKSLVKEETLEKSQNLDSIKKEAMSLAKAHFTTESDFEKALNSLDFQAAGIESHQKVSSMDDCLAYWQKEFMGSNILNDLMDEARSAEKDFREKIGAPYVP